MSIEYSVTIPLQNEACNIFDLLEELEPIMNSLKEPWELICVDDGSTDQTLLLLAELAKDRPHLKVISFERNYGQSSAFDAGFKAASGKYIITLDGDGQNDPADIPKLVSFRKQYDLICGVRAKRQDSWVKRFTSKAANGFRNWVFQENIKDTGCSLKVYNKDCLLKLKLYHGLHRHFPILFKIEGFSVHQETVNHRPRIKGVSKYNFFNRSFNTVADLLAVYWMKKRHLRYKIACVKNFQDQ